MRPPGSGSGAADVPGRSSWRSVLGALGLAASLAACGTLPTGAPRAPSAAIAASTETALGRIASVSTPSAEQSGVRLLPLGAYSLDTRVQLIDRAQASLDLQYYQIENDATGRLLLRKLRDAAARGVRVRLLVDDLYTGRIDTLLRQLAAHPNVEVRLANPFCCARNSGVGGRYAASILDFGRLNHRMHNKLFIADGVMAVAGGRNIGDGYFLRHSESNFVDIDAFVMGRVVADMAAIFDRYWNSDAVAPVESIGAHPDDPGTDPRTARAAFSRTLDAAADAPALQPPTVDVLGYGPLRDDLDAGRIGLVWGTARAFADPPEKLLSRSDETLPGNASVDARMRIWRAASELVVTSPYLIPGRLGAQAFDALRDRNVKVTIVTNSLAATDEPLVHTGYARYRIGLLKSGVDLYELSPTRAQATKRLGVFGRSLGRLHAKTAVIDRETIFIGSMNLDPRSASVNTEFGMFIDSPLLARELLRVINVSKLESAYHVRLAPDGKTLQWAATDGDRVVILGVEPESSGWLRLHNFLFGLFVPEQLL